MTNERIEWLQDRLYNNEGQYPGQLLQKELFQEVLRLQAKCNRLIDGHRAMCTIDNPDDGLARMKEHMDAIGMIPGDLDTEGEAMP